MAEAARVEVCPRCKGTGSLYWPEDCGGCRGEGQVTPADIAAAREAGWPDFHPEDFCHRCGRPNVRSWFAARDLWEAALDVERGPAETGDPILCPPCFVVAYEQQTGQKVTWELCPWRPSPNAASDRSTDGD